MKIFYAIFCLVSTLWVPAAFGACDNWDVSGRALVLHQSNAHFVSFNLSQDGADLSGIAEYSRVEPPQMILGVLQIGSDYIQKQGLVVGELNGSNIKLQVNWPASAYGVYELTIDENGRFTGTTYDFNKPSSNAQVLGFNKLNCIQQALPRTARGMGKGKPTSPAVSAADVQRAKVDSGLLTTSFPSKACASGYVWREATPNDSVCVPPASRSRVAAENAQSAALWDSKGAYGPKTCISGYVWREAFQGDVVCVTVQARNLAREENKLASSRVN